MSNTTKDGMQSANIEAELKKHPLLTAKKAVRASDVYPQVLKSTSTDLWLKDKRILERKLENIRLSLGSLSEPDHMSQGKINGSARLTILPSFERRMSSIQNKHITTQLYQIQCAVKKLIDRGFMVIDAQITHSRPQIEIRYQANCENLNGINCTLSKSNEEADEIMVSQFCHCDVTWVQPEYVRQLKALMGDDNE